MRPPRSLAARCGAVGLAWSCAIGQVLAQAPVEGGAAGEARASATSPAPDAVAVLPLAVRGKLADRLPRTLEERLVAALRRGDAAILSAEDLRAGAEPCDETCLRAAALAAGAAYLVRAEVSVEGRDYALRLSLTRTGSGEELASVADTCEICGHEELAERVDDLAAALGRKLKAAVVPPPRLRVLGRPAGSRVTIDGQEVGVSPLELSVAAGEHEVVIEKEGFTGVRRRVAFVDGVVETLDLALVELPRAAAPAPVPPRRRWVEPLGWSGVGLGVGAAAGGVVLVALDQRPIRGDCQGANVDAEGDCKWRYDTLAGGVVLTVLGVAAIAVGAAIVGRERQRARRGQARASAWVDPAGLAVRF